MTLGIVEIMFLFAALIPIVDKHEAVGLPEAITKNWR